MKKIIRLTERDLTRLVKRVINENKESVTDYEEVMNELLSDFVYEIKEKIKEFEKAFNVVGNVLEYNKDLDDDNRKELFDMLRHYSYQIEKVKDVVDKF